MAPLRVVLDAPDRPGAVVLQGLTDDGAPTTRTEVLTAELPAAVAEVERTEHPR